MNQPASPFALSVSLVTPDDFETIRRTVRHLQAQTIRDQLELVITAPSRAQLRLDEAAVAGFGAVQIVEVGPVRSLAAAHATALTRMQGRYVAFAEDHSFPDPDWAETLLAAHRAGHAVVGPRVDNGNPATTLSWANFIACFWRWTGPVTADGTTHTPYHNTSYRRDLLLAFGDRLATLLVTEHLLQDILRAQGHHPYLVTTTRTQHVNFSRVRPWCLHAYLGGRLFGGQRWLCEHWPAWKRAVYVVGSPLIPWVRLWRTIPVMRRDPRQWERWPRKLAWLFAGFIIHAFGEVVGYVAGAGAVAVRYSQLESHRLDHVTARDREALSVA